MAKVEVENRAFGEPRLRTAVAHYKVSQSVIMGYALTLWHFSQQEGVVEATEAQILGWLDTDRFSKPERAIEWLKAADYLRPGENGSLIIAGNAIAVPRTKIRKQNAQNAVRHRILKRSSIEPIIDSIISRSSTRSSTRSSVDHPDKETVLQRGLKPSPTDVAGPPGSLVWDTYSGAYLNRYGVMPIRNAKTNALCKQLVKRLGIDSAIAVVGFYLTHGKGYYIEKAHDLGLCILDAEALHTQMMKGQIITRVSASHAEKNTTNAASFNAVARKLAAERENENGK